MHLKNFVLAACCILSISARAQDPPDVRVIQWRTTSPERVENKKNLGPTQKELEEQQQSREREREKNEIRKAQEVEMAKLSSARAAREREYREGLDRRLKNLKSPNPKRSDGRWIDEPR